MFTDVSEERAAYIFYPEDGDSTFLSNTGKYLPGYRPSHPRRQPSSKLNLFQNTY
jgi:hypothetical protein